MFYPRLIAAGTEYCSGQSGNCDIEDEPQAAFAHSYPRAYRINGRAGNRYHAYRMTLTVTDAIGEYYGVQGTTWNDPPLLSSPSGTTLLHAASCFSTRTVTSSPRWRGIATATPTGSRTR